MKPRFFNLLFLFGIMISLSMQTAVADGAAQSTFDKEWQAVYELEQKGKPRSAIDILNKIYEQAKADKNEAQMIKALEFHLSKLRPYFALFTDLKSRVAV